MLPDGSWSFKDWDLLDEHLASGRYSAEKVARIRADGLRIGAELDAGARWWSDEWVTWKPDPLWTAPGCPTAGATSPSDRALLHRTADDRADRSASMRKPSWPWIGLDHLHAAARDEVGELVCSRSG